MSRYLLTAALLVLAATAQGMTPSRQGANGSGGSCPQAQEHAVVEEAGTADQQTVRNEPATPAATPVPAKSGAAARPKTGARWHSFLPGMFR
jgi:hypothetical protein